MSHEDNGRSPSRRRRGLSAAGFAVAVVTLSVVVTSGIGVAATTTTPVNTAEPTISGTAFVGSTLTTTSGTWSPSPDQPVAYQWVRCPASGGSNDGSDCAVIGGASTAAYVVANGDVGSRLRVRVTATNGGDSATAASNPTELIGAVPARVADPVVSGSAVVGSRLTANQGTWANNPTSFAYQWVRCPSSGGNPTGSDCAAIGGATSTTYVVASADVGRRLRVRVTASNASGTATSASNATAVVLAASQAPRNTSEPRISGTARVGSTLTTSQGSWTNQPTSYAYQWFSCPTSGGRADASDCAAIGGATAQSYVPSAGVQARRLRVRVTAANRSGSGVAVSNSTAAVQPGTPAPAPTGCPAGRDPIRIDQLGPPARLLIDGQSIVPSPVRRSTQSLTLRFRVSACGGRPVVGALVYVTGVPYNQFSIPREQATGGDGWAQVTMNRLRGFPASSRQQLLVTFVRARKGGENILSGISTRRLVSFRVNLRR